MGLQPVHMGKDSVTLLTWTKILGKPTILVYIKLGSYGVTQPPSSAEFLLHLYFVATTLWFKGRFCYLAPPSSPRLTAPQLVSSAPQFASELQWQNLHRQTSVFTGFRWKAVCATVENWLSTDRGGMSAIHGNHGLFDFLDTYNLYT